MIPQIHKIWRIRDRGIGSFFQSRLHTAASVSCGQWHICLHHCTIADDSHSLTFSALSPYPWGLSVFDDNIDDLVSILLYSENHPQTKILYEKISVLVQLVIYFLPH